MNQFYGKIKENLEYDFIKYNSIESLISIIVLAEGFHKNIHHMFLLTNVELQLGGKHLFEQKSQFHCLFSMTNLIHFILMYLIKWKSIFRQTRHSHFCKKYLCK